MNFGFSGEMIFIFFLALILFGPKKLPAIGRTIGRFMNEFRRASNEFRSQIESEINSLDSALPKQQILPPMQAPLGSLASRIFNPPSAEKLAAVQEEAAEAERLKAVESVARKAAESVPEPAPAPKAAADA